MLFVESSIWNLVYYLLWRTEEHTGIVVFLLIAWSALAFFVVIVVYKYFHSGLVVSVAFWVVGIGSSMISVGEFEAGLSTRYVSQKPALWLKPDMIINNDDHCFYLSVGFFTILLQLWVKHPIGTVMNNGWPWRIELSRIHTSSYYYN